MTFRPRIFVWLLCIGLSCSPLSARASNQTSSGKAASSPLSTPRGWWNNSYLIDWGVALGLAGGGLALVALKEPPTRPFRKDDPSIGLPLKEETISEPVAAALSIGIPLATIALAQLWLKSPDDAHRAILGLFEAMSLNFFFTSLIKVSVGRLRPDFIERCKPDASLSCTGDAEEVRKGRRSFPSGHSSFAFTGGVYMAMYLWGKLHPFDGTGTFWKVPLILAPVTGAALIAMTRFTDNRHHWEDIFIGGLLGTSLAILAYRLNFPFPWEKKSEAPHPRVALRFTPILSPEQVGLAMYGQF